MAKNKSFDFQSLIPEAEAPASAPKVIEASPPVTILDPQEIVKSKEIVTSRANEEQQTNIPESADEIKGQLAMQPNRKKKKDKRVNFLVNEEEYNDFTRINKNLGYSNNEMIGHLISEYIKSNK